MKARVALASAALATATALAALSIGRASDHLDGPRATSDPASDITDVFAFTSPEDSTKVVLALAVTPYAGSASSFSPDVEYAFRVRRVAALQPLTFYDTVLDVTCNFTGEDGAASTVTCTGPAGMQASAPVGQTTGQGGAMRVFAGLRSDPAFFDRQGALATLATGRTSFTGQNAFAGANVLAVVVEMPSSTFLFVPDAGSASDAATTDAGSPADAGPVSPVLAVSAETVRRGS